MAHVLKIFRVRNDLTLSEFATRLGSNPSTLSKIEKGRMKAPTDLAKAIEANTQGEVKRHELRPDIWDAPTNAEAAE